MRTQPKALPLLVRFLFLILASPFAVGQGNSLTPLETAEAGLTVSTGANIRDSSSGCSQVDNDGDFEPFWSGGVFVGASSSNTAASAANCGTRSTTSNAVVDFDFTSNEIHVAGSVQATAQNVPVSNPPVAGYDARVFCDFPFSVGAPTLVTLNGQGTGAYFLSLVRGSTKLYEGQLDGNLGLNLLAGDYLLQVETQVASSAQSVPDFLAGSFDVTLLVATDQTSGGLKLRGGPPLPGGNVTDTTAPVVSNLVIDTLGGGNVNLSWNTNEPTRALLDYGLTPAYGTTIDLGPQFARDYELVLNDLALDETYHFRLRVRDGFHNQTNTPNATFDTPPLGDAQVSGSRETWYPLTLDFTGPMGSELNSTPNPFLDYRTTVVFTGPSGQTYSVPGFFAGDGNGGSTGNVWRVRFAPDQSGFWSYEAHFVSGPNIAIDLDPLAGTPLAFDGDVGTIEILEPSRSEGFYPFGKLEYVRGHYLKFRDGSYFLKTGCGSPENFLGYVGFDNTYDQGGADTSGLDNGRHRFDPHVADWGPSGLGDSNDPLFTSADTGDDSKGIIGALNYLASRDVNAIYFLPMNLGGDGQETCPFVGYADTGFDKTHYDLSKLRQWNMVFEHATRRGILLHVVLAETELGNRTWLDGGSLGVQRKLFYREMIARFGHNLAIKWNLSEENLYSTTEVESFADYILALDPYDHPVGFHSVSLPPTSDNPQWDPVLGDPRFTTNSIQGNIGNVGSHVEVWRERSSKAGQPWVVEMDEITGGLTDSNANTYRKQGLYDVLFSGGNIEFYLGYFPLPLGGDLRVENFRTRELMWDYAAFARSLMEEYMPFWEMEPMDSLVQGEDLHPDGGGAEVFVKPGDTYAIYYPVATETGTLDLTGHPGLFLKRWYNPRTGAFVGAFQTVFGGGDLDVGAPPSGDASEDWVVLILRNIP